jgi:hypothetical protein
VAVKVSHDNDLHHRSRVLPYFTDCFSEAIMLWVNKDVEAEQVPIESPDLTAAVIRLPERLIFMASVYVEGGDAAALDDACDRLRKAISKVRQDAGTVVGLVVTILSSAVPCLGASFE